MKIILFFCGKIKPSEFFYIENIYIRRLINRNVDVIEYKNNKKDNNSKISQKNIIQFTQPQDFIVICDERGKVLTTDRLVSLIRESREKSKYLTNYKRLVFIIGSPSGFSDDVRNNANLVFSLSGLILGGGIARLVLLEALYRANMILDNHPYHNE
tara:strand:- start:385 stop:852 length:468 start_codon:yes stop_codon:yes gene_type:complete